MGEEHEQAVKTLVEMWVFLGLKELYAQVWTIVRKTISSCRRRRTCEDGRFEELDELVNLDECVDSHLHVSAVYISINQTDKCREPTRLEGDDTPARKLEQAGRARMWPQHYDTTP